MNDPVRFDDIEAKVYFRFGEKYCNQVYQKWEAGDKFILPCLSSVRFNLNNLSTPFPRLGQTPVILLSPEEELAQEQKTNRYHTTWADYKAAILPLGGEWIDIDNIDDLMALVENRIQQNLEDTMSWQGLLYRTLDLDRTFCAAYAYLSRIAAKGEGWRDAYILLREGIYYLMEDDIDAQLGLPCELAYASLNLLAYEDTKKFASRVIEYGKKHSDVIQAEGPAYVETVARAYLFRAIAGFLPIVKTLEIDGVQGVSEKEKNQIDSDIAEGCKLMMHDLESFRFYLEQLQAIEGIPRKYGDAFITLCIEVEKFLIKAMERATKKKAGFGWRGKK